MKITEREKKILIAGAVIAVFIVLIAPLVRKWAEMGERLEPKLTYVSMLKDRVEGQDSLLSRRNALVRRLGSLTGMDASEAGKDKSEKEAKSEKAKEGGEGEKEDKTKEAKEDDENVEKEGEVGETEEKTEADAEAVEKPLETAEENGEGPEAEKSGEEEEAEKVEDGDRGEARGEEGQKTGSEVTSGEDEKGKDGKENESEKGEDADEGTGQPNEDGEKAKEEGEASADKGGESVEKKGQSPEHVRLAAYVERMAQQSGMKFKRVTPKRVAAGAQTSKSFDAAAVQFSVEGNIRNLVKMLHALEKGERFVRVEQMQLQRNLEQGGTVEASLDVMAYEARAR